MRVDDGRIAGLGASHGEGVGGGVVDRFPVGMRVLAVDDDPTCLKVLEALLRRCQYHVTTTNQAVKALEMLRRNKDEFDLVISDVHMPDMDGFKLLELVGLEMDLPVIMLSVNGETKTVMKGITHGACDYLLKPVRIEELRNIWQHVVRRRYNNRERHIDDFEDHDKPLAVNAEHLPSQTSNVPCESSSKFSKKRKDQDDGEDDDFDDNADENDESSSQKKPRVVWSIELHRKFVAAVNQLGINKAVPKRILELMNVEKLTRENVASHLQKYRLYLKRLSAVASQQASIVAAFGGRDSYLCMSAFEGLQNFRTLSSSGPNQAVLNPSGQNPAVMPYYPQGLMNISSAAPSGIPTLAPSGNVLDASTTSTINPQGTLTMSSAVVPGLHSLPSAGNILDTTIKNTMSHTANDLGKRQLLSLTHQLHDGQVQCLTSTVQPEVLQQKLMQQDTDSINNCFSVENMPGALLPSFMNNHVLTQVPTEASLQTKVEVQRVSSTRTEAFNSIAVSSSLLHSMGCTEPAQSSIAMTGAKPSSLPVGTFNGSAARKQTCLLEASNRSDNILAGSLATSLPVREVKSEGGSLDKTSNLPPSNIHDGSRILNFSNVDDPRRKARMSSTDCVLDSKAQWGSFWSSEPVNNFAIGSATAISHQLLDSCSTQNTGANILGSTSTSFITAGLRAKNDMPNSVDCGKQWDEHAMGISKLQGLGTDDFDGLLHSIIKMERDDVSFMDGCDMVSYDMFSSLDACI